MRLHPLRTSAVVTLALVAALARAADYPPQPLEERVEALDKTVADLTRRLASAERASADSADVVRQGATKGSFRLPGSSTSVTAGGYVKLDAVFSNPSAGVNSTADLFLQPNAIPVGPGAGDNEHSQVKFGARESRLFFKTSTPTALGEAVTYIEGDFYGADGNESVSNSHGLRLRHAYGSLGPLLAGQTWTNFMFPSSLPETVDFGGAVGEVFARQAQLRWTQPLAMSGLLPGSQWSVAVENPESVVALSNGTTFRADDDRYPDLTAQLLLATSYGRVALSALARDVRVDSASAPAAVAHARGAAFSVAAILPTVGKDDARFELTAGNVVGRYSNGFFPDGVLDAQGHLRLPSQVQWYAAYRHFWSERWRSNVVLAQASERNPAGTAGSTNKSTRSAHANLIFSPVTGTDLGVELIGADRETEDGQRGRLRRVQLSAKYAF